MSIVSLFCEIDDFFLALETYQAQRAVPSTQRPERRGHRRNLHTSEVMTILVAFHQSQYRTFKAYYQKHVCLYWRWAFPKLVSYNRFVELMPEAFFALRVYLYTRFGKCSGISFIDSTPLSVCGNRRIATHRVFLKQAGRSKTSVGWFYGLKLHLIINEHGELLSVDLTPGNTDDRQPVRKLAVSLFGKLYGDKGYISQPLREALRTQGISLIYKRRKNMKSDHSSTFDTLMLKKRTLVESVVKELKSQTQLEHTRHRSFKNFQVNMVSALIAYTYLSKKPSLNPKSMKSKTH